MELQEFFQKLNHEQLKKLAETRSTEALLGKVHELGLKLTREEAEQVFAALYPARSRKLDDDELEIITGGAQPDPTWLWYDKKLPTSL